MATDKSKIETLRSKLGPEHDSDIDEILKKAQEREKQGESSGIPFALKSKKRAADTSRDVEGDIDDDEEKEPEMTDAEDDEPEEGGEEDDDEDGEEEKSRDYVGDMTLAEFSSVVSEALAAAVDPYLHENKQLKQRIMKVEEALTVTTKERGETMDILEDLNKQIGKLESQLKEAKKSLEKLTSDAPANVRGYVASEADDTVTTDKEKINRTPAADPAAKSFADFISFATSNAQNPGQ